MPFTPKFVDLVRNVISVTGTGPVTLGQAVSGYTSLAAAVSAGEQFYYCIQGVDKPQEREVGRGTMQSDGKVARQPILGSPTNFSGGTKTIALVAAAEWFAKLDQIGSGCMGAVADRVELAGKDGLVTGRMFLAEAGRAGSFVFDPSNLSAKVLADPNQGLYVAPASAPTGASGAWVRKFDGPVNVKWFGATGDGVTGDGPAFVAAIAFLKAISLPGFGYSKGSPRLFVPAGDYNLGTTTLDLTHSLIIEGENSGDATGGGTVLKWAANTTGIRIQSANTIGATGTQAAASSRGSASLIRNLMLIGGYAGTDGEAHGIHLRGMATLRDVYIEGFSGDGIHSFASSGAGGEYEGNANSIEVSRTYIENCRHGIYLDGADVNAGTFSAVNVKNARGWGIWDSSFLANTYVGCHAAGCGLGPYNSNNANAPNAFVGCYSESGQPPSSFVSPTIVIGGLHGAGIAGTAAYLTGAQMTSFGLAQLGKLTVGEGVGNTTLVTVHNKSSLASGLQSRLAFAQGFEADGVTPCVLGAISGYSNSSNPATAEGLLGFYTRAYGTGILTERMVINEASTTFAPSDDNYLHLGISARRWKSIHAMSIASYGALTSNSATGGVGYAAGAGGAITQATSKSTGVTLNKLSGQITMSAAALASNASVSFTLSNSAIAATDALIVNIGSGATVDAYIVQVTAVGAGSARIQVRNMSGGSLSEALVLNVAVIKAVAA